MKEKEKLLNWSISIITILLSSMKFWLWRTGDKSLRVDEKFIRKLYMSNLISPGDRSRFRLFAVNSYSQLRQCRWVHDYISRKALFKLIC